MTLAPSFTGKTAVVTGAAQGIGQATALLLDDAGASVWGVDRDAANLSNLSRDRFSIRTRTVDVSDGAAVTDLAAVVGGADVLVNCAGIVPLGSVLDCSEDEWRRTFDVNVTSMYHTIRAFLPAMIDRGGGSIVNIASVVSSVKAVPNRFAYGASKAAVIGLTKAVAADFVGKGIRCNVVCPGTIDTPSLGDRLAAFPDPEEARRDFIARQPVGRLGTAEEVAALVLYLASDASAYTTGAVHVIDGGMAL